ncbi:Glycosyl hydrolases family 2 [Granulicella pectinivorans]|uniref:Glycosyl hydrolases family 2 n=1 Tax=Granulicella pectinivorans TaxID=474950 RepID=A0A1I6MAH8_9BACT|nr:sugar-binding domain-containing protein [Granulicella pectinivorans]SFS12726.1 Glycosyl hydrolases family 2 [Granulicella pectinivorans]
MNRRSFLSSSALLSASCALNTAPLAAEATDAPLLTSTTRSVRYSDTEMLIPDEGWHLWPDRAATWKDDTIYLPEDVQLATLPVNPPTGGWSALAPSQGLDVTLPATVEQFFWGINGFFPFKDEYKFETTDHEVKNGAYYGVSWWWRDITLPKTFSGKRTLLHIRGARQRAEVYLNQKLVGYSIMEELPFECDLTAAILPGQRNQLAIRITNPGGRLDWVDGNRLAWGGIEFQKSHGFGGIDRGMVLSAHNDLRIADSWALNTPTPRQITAHASLENTGTAPAHGIVRFSVVDPGSKTILTTTDVPATIAPGEPQELHTTLTAASAKIWDLDTPHVYRLRTQWIDTARKPTAVRDVDFGFRWIATEGIGTKAIFRLNGRRIRIYTSISWGFWALNGLFPLLALSEKEVRVAKEKFNLNTLNFHRNLGKEDVLYVQDRLGLMRCLEPGGGAQGFTPASQGHQSARRYMQAKITGMIRAFRSHPSVVHYIIQNETTLDPQSPDLAELFHRMQAEDPSRTIVGNDGFVMRAPQAWTEPYQSEIHKSKGKATLEGGAGGWWVDHTGHFSDVWQDAYYVNKTDFYFYTPVKAEITEWGEMKGAASIDNHTSILREINLHGGHSYDKLDHEQQLAAYDAFLDAWGFRKAFPTAEKLFLSIGRRAYETWGQFMENVRICDENDMAAISGWESTAMENHSGLVDNFRDLKSDPAPIFNALRPIRPVAKQKQIVLFTSDHATFDTWLLNDTNAPVAGTLQLTVESPKGSIAEVATYPAPAFVADQLSYLLQEEVKTPPLSIPGTWKVRLALSTHPDVTHETALLVVDPTPANFRPLRVGLARVSPQLEATLGQIEHLTLEAFQPGAKYDVIVGSGGSSDASKDLATDAEGAYKPGSGPLPEFTLPDEVMVAVRAGTPLLAITPTDGQSIGVAKQLAALGAFTFHGMVGASRASWMGSWYFIRQHPLYDGMPVDQAMSIHYQVKGGGSNGWMVDGPSVEIPCAYARDHDRNLGAGTFTARVGATPIVMHRIVDMHPVLLRRWLANTLTWLSLQGVWKG